MVILSTADIATDLMPRVSASFEDPRYVLPAVDYITDIFLPWYGRHLLKSDLRWRKDVFDCDDFARHFAAMLVDAARALRADAAVAVAILHARNLVTSLGIPQGNHCLNLVGVKTETGRDWLVIEPQNQLHVPLARFETADRLRAAF